MSIFPSPAQLQKKSHSTQCFTMIPIHMSDCVYLRHNVSVSVTGSQVQWSIISTVHYVDACTSHDEHINNTTPPLPAGPVQRAEAMVIPGIQNTKYILKKKIINISIIFKSLKTTIGLIYLFQHCVLLDKYSRT